jgi:hypothetical protein
LKNFIKLKFIGTVNIHDWQFTENNDNSLKTNITSIVKLIKCFTYLIYCRKLKAFWINNINENDLLIRVENNVIGK